MRNPELPPGTKPHDSDPPEQKPLAGRFTATLTIDVSGNIHGSGNPVWRGDDVFTKDQLEKFVRTGVASAFLNQVDCRVRLDEVISVEIDRFEPD